MSYKAIISAIASCINEQHLSKGAATDAGPDLELLTDEIIAQQRRMPDYLPFPIAVLTWLFEFSGILFTLQRFSRQSSDARAKQLLAWKNSPIGVCRNFVRFYESLFLLVALDDDFLSGAATQ